MPSYTGLEGPLGRLFAALDPLKNGFVKAEDLPKALTGLGMFFLTIFSLFGRVNHSSSVFRVY